MEYRFVGGSDLAAGEAVFAEVQKHLLPEFGLRVSVMLDSNGANTTAWRCTTRC